jgi:UDP-glucose 4-epimerase
VAIFAGKLLTGQAPVINGDGNQTRDYVFVGDAIEANIKAIESDFVGCVNIGTETETTVNELFDILKSASGNKDLHEQHGPAKPGEQHRSVLANGHAKKVLGWEPAISITKGLEMTYKWFENNSKS